MSKRNSLSLEDVKDMAIDWLIFLSPFVVSNIDTIQKSLEAYVSDPTIVALGVSFILYVAKKYIQGPNTSTNGNK